MKCRYMAIMLQCSKTFLFILGSCLAIDKLFQLMPCSSIVNKVCRPAEKKTAGEKTTQHKSKSNRFLQTKDMYLHFIRSNMGANLNR